MSSDEVVVDASLALKWAEQEPYSAEASALLEDWHRQRRRLLAPALFAYEATNAIAKRVKRGQLTLQVAKERLAALLENGPALEQDTTVNLRALEVVERFALPSAYDAHYLALAEARQCEMLDSRRTPLEHSQKGAALGPLYRPACHCGKGVRP